MRRRRTQRKQAQGTERYRSRKTDPFESDVLVFPIDVNAHLSSAAAITIRSRQNIERIKLNRLQYFHSIITGLIIIT